MHRCKNHSRRADAALRATAFEERLLQRMHQRVRRHSFDGNDACATRTRQLFTSIPSNKTEHEPHSPSPHPSFVPVNFKSFRSTSNNLSMGWARSFFASPLTVNETSHFALAAGNGFMPSLASKKEHLAQEARAPAPQTNLPAATESNGSEYRSHLPRRLRSLAQGHPWVVLRCPWHHARRERCQAPQKTRESAAGPPRSA